MVDPVTATLIATLITSSASLFVAILTHLKSSKCFGVDMEFTSTPTSPITTNASAIITPTPVGR